MSEIQRTHKITQLWRNFIFSYVSLFSHSFYQKYIMMKFKWQLNFNTIHIMRSGENRRRMRREKNGKHNMICMCVVLLTCVNFNELAFIIYHVLLKHPFFKPSRQKKPHTHSTSLVLLCFLGKLWSLEIEWRDKAALNLLKAKRPSLWMWDYFFTFCLFTTHNFKSKESASRMAVSTSNLVISFHLIS